MAFMCIGIHLQIDYSTAIGTWKREWIYPIRTVEAEGRHQGKEMFRKQKILCGNAQSHSTRILQDAEFGFSFC